jgi:hypothetical protein
MGLAGTGSGAGGFWPGFGTSEASTAGGVASRYGQESVPVAAFGSALATAGIASIATAAAEHSKRRDTPLRFAIDLQGRG